MINGILRIDSFGPFQRWRLVPGTTPFKRVNLIYGSNASGKSSLASLFESAAADSLPPGVGLQIEILEPDSSLRTVLEGDPFWERVYVFNKSYVRRSISFDAKDGPNAEGLLVIGELNVANQEELEAAKKRMAEIDAGIVIAETSRDESGRRLARLLSNLRDTIVSELKDSDDRYRSTNAYRVNEVRAVLLGDRVEFAKASKDIAADLALAGSEQPVPLDWRPPTEVAQDLISRASSLISTSVVVQVLEGLAEGGPKSDWVQAGIKLHEHEDDCLFCGQSLPRERVAALSAHFDDALVRVQTAAESLIKVAKEAQAIARAAARSLPEPSTLIAPIREKYLVARSDFAKDLEDYANAIDAVVAALEHKHSHPLDVFTPQPLPPLDWPDATEVSRYTDEHDSKVASHRSMVHDAAKRVELARIADAIARFDEDYEINSTAIERITGYNSEREETKRRIVQLENAEADPVPLATDLTTDVARLLGRDELTFSPTDDGRRFRITRNGDPAVGLSEGEQTAISLLHFLASLKAKGTSLRPVVVVDDPVSSLDQNILFGVSAHLWAQLVLGSMDMQIFVLSHSFDLFRQWTGQLDSFPANIVGGHTTFELRMRRRLVSGVARRVPVFEEWPIDPQERRRLRSQYHFLFHQVASAVIESNEGASLARQMEILALAPNSARKMLEAFLSFRYPEHIGNFTAGMRTALEKVDNTTRTRVTRYLHAYSHNEEGDIGKPLEPGEATAVLSSVFQLMKTLDPEHFASMCESLNLDQNLLLLTKS